MERIQIYKCLACGNVVEVLNAGGGELVCCGRPMTLQSENTTDAATEKHIPVVEKDGDIIKVKVGSVAHPMTDEHYIQWIEVVANEKVYRKFLNPTDTPEAEFNISANNIKVRAYCNLHGLWKGKE